MQCNNTRIVLLHCTFPTAETAETAACGGGASPSPAPPPEPERITYRVTVR
ncbi:hypothetical protein ABT330_03545 [Streptomyces sp. NPDC000658]|uniref:hypothetical protein n=1 Tax=Streptomyces sp. NPDC000658 TaxID=3154266 RepID=UPI003328B723